MKSAQLGSLRSLRRTNSLERSKLSFCLLAVYGEKNKGLWTSEKKMSSIFPLIYTLESGHIMMADNPDSFYGEVAKS